MPRLSSLLQLALLAAAASLAGCAMNTARPVSAPGSVHQQLFTQNWRFKLLQTDAPSSNPAYNPVAGAIVELENLTDAWAGNINDSSWRTLDLPHDWSIEQPFDQKYASGTGFLPGGIAWYRKHFTLTPEQQNKTLTVRFDGIYKNSSVYLNGHKLGDRPYGYSSFEYDLTPYLNQSGDNVLAVRVNHHDFADSRWYPGSGIYRNVYLTTSNPVHVDHYGTFVTTPSITKDVATVLIQETLRNDGDVQASFMLETQILNRKGQVISSAGATNGVAAKSSETSTTRIDITNPELWTLDQPTMYTAVTLIRNKEGKILDRYNTPFGIRTIKFDPNTGFWLNGVNMKIKGVCLHEDAGALGSAIPQQVWERRLLLLRSAGTNAIRCSHNPPAPEFLDLCDRLGFLVMDEAFDEWNAPTFTGPQGKKKWIDTWSGTKFDLDGYHADFDKWADTDIKDMVLRDRNHPSIIMWSIGNEIDYPNDPYPPNNMDLVPVAQRLVADVKSLDTTRPVTAACADIGENKWFQYLDIVGYNYQESRYAADHAANPTRIIFGSENDIKRLSDWNAVKDNPFISSQFLWTGIDYLGEAGRPAPGTKSAWPERSRPDGFLDLAGFKKPMYYYRKSLWTDEPMVKIEANLPEEDKDKKLVVPPGLSCYTNCDTVEFLQNGKSLGTFPLAADTHIIKVPADPAAGPILAVAKRSVKGAIASTAKVTLNATDTYTLPGPPAKIDLWSYPSLLGPGDGPNVAQIELSLLDANGNLADAANDVTVYLAGPGRLLGIESGDKDSHENYQAATHKAFHGRLLLYIETRGKVTIKTSAPGLIPAVIKVGG